MENISFSERTQEERYGYISFIFPKDITSCVQRILTTSGKFEDITMLLSEINEKDGRVIIEVVQSTRGKIKYIFDQPLLDYYDAASTDGINISRYYANEIIDSVRVESEEVILPIDEKVAVS